jgi:hypothetical protein
MHFLGTFLENCYSYVLWSLPEFWMARDVCLLLDLLVYFVELVLSVNVSDQFVKVLEIQRAQLVFEL